MLQLSCRHFSINCRIIKLFCVHGRVILRHDRSHSCYWKLFCGSICGHLSKCMHQLSCGIVLCHNRSICRDG